MDSTHRRRIQKYYRFHSRFYDPSRWTFLFGRNKIIQMIPPLPPSPRILEVGCGTGRNLKKLCRRFPAARVTGMDLSSHMLHIAERKRNARDTYELVHADYLSASRQSGPFDLILISYSLTMFGSNTGHILKQVGSDLKAGGFVAALDFHTSPLNWFRQWMEMNHVDFSGSFLPALQDEFQTVEMKTHKAYAGCWNYFLFLGSKGEAAADY